MSLVYQPEAAVLIYRGGYRKFGQGYRKFEKVDNDGVGRLNPKFHFRYVSEIVLGYRKSYLYIFVLLYKLTFFVVPRQQTR